MPSRKYVACRRFSMLEAYYEPGEEVDVEQLPDHKVQQLLRQRYIRPVI
jgi:hypothetical protein